MLRAATLALLTLASIAAAEAAREVPLWPHGAPGFEGVTAEEIDESVSAQHNYRKIWNIHNPSITVYLPPKKKASGAAVIIAPGGAHQFLAKHEGYDAGEYLAAHGVAGFVLKCRLEKTEGFHYKVEVHSLQDALRAVRTVRSRAGERNVDPAKVRVEEFSDGGAVAWLAATRFEQGRPGYLVIPDNAPPAFLICSYDDNGPASNLPALFLAFKKARVQTELHIYARGGHGFGMRERDLPVTSWNGRVLEWMADLKIARTP